MYIHSGGHNRILNKCSFNMKIVLCSQLFWVAINSEWIIQLLRKNLQVCMTGQDILLI